MISFSESAVRKKKKKNNYVKDFGLLIYMLKALNVNNAIFL